MIEKLEFDALGTTLQSRPFHFLARVGFETRSIEIIGRTPQYEWTSFTYFVSKNRSEVAQKNVGAASSVKALNRGDYELDTQDPIQVARQLYDGVHHFHDHARGAPALLDITSFRREELLILLSLISSLPRNDVADWHLAYVGAKFMGEWLSGEVTEVRSVLGYPGEARPSKSTRLVILMGFEVSRARRIIESYEPKEIVLGMGRKADSINDDLYARNKELFDQLGREFKESIESTFEFSARDPVAVKQELINVIGDPTRANLVIAPLHTKLSTIGAGLYGASEPLAQICYASVDEYNEAAYSAPGTDVYLIPLKDILEHHPTGGTGPKLNL
ncbi:hypothetical protein KHC17_25235 (plasmid) [Agrobacterium salinitolerans]|uniref:hypothetical protein n=1 Tax=Agrobacterium salinitolerans TaxID=1183413 RepID=UPI001C24B5F7|nr:hypothetical protein [Agrobacterium salinitolerans]QXC52442.1 hypothetical protein KHC17_25235 [Agrobacterium salinitolerans]